MTQRPHPTTFLPMAAGYDKLVGHHRHLLDDRVRTTAFLRAIARVVKPGDIVADLGTGTGILAMAARRAGARAVWAIDRDPIVQLAAAIARDNAIDGITFVEQHSRDLTLPVPVDVLISECFGPFAIGGTMIRALTELRTRSLVPQGRIVPRGIELFVAPVEDAALYRELGVFARPRYGIAWTAAHALAMQNVYNTVVAPRSLLSRPARLHAIDLETAHWRGDLDATVELAPTRAGRVHAIAGWFTADLGGGVTLSTAPGKPVTIWRQIVFPLPAAIRVRARQPIELQLRCLGGEHFDWRVRVGMTEHTCSTRYSTPRAV